MIQLKLSVRNVCSPYTYVCFQSEKERKTVHVFDLITSHMGQTANRIERVSVIKAKRKIT